MTQKHYNIKVSGKVQNVGFRYATMKAALENNIRGFVRNQRDGSVYIEAEGDENDMDLFINWCHQGPTWARVDHVNLSESNIENYKEFTIS